MLTSSGDLCEFTSGVQQFVVDPAYTLRSWVARSASMADLEVAHRTDATGGEISLRGCSELQAALHILIKFAVRFKGEIGGGGWWGEPVVELEQLSNIARAPSGVTSRISFWPPLRFSDCSCA